MNAGVDRLVRAAVHVAWRRWPANLRDERRREWEAELAVLASEPGRGRLARSVGRLRFALSLAWSPPVADEHGVPRGWPDLLTGLGRALRAPIALAATALVGWAALAALDTVVRSALASTFAPSRDGVDWRGAGLNAIVLAAVAATGLFGRWLGRRLPMNWAHRGRLGETGSAVVAPLVLGALFLGVDRLATPDIEAGPGIETFLPPDVVPAVLVWAAIVVVVAVAVVRLTRRERPAPGRAWLVGVGGGALALWIAGIVGGMRTALRVGLDPLTAPLWTPQALLLPRGSGPAYGARSQGWVASEEVVGFVGGTVRPLLLATVLAIAYAAVARPRPEPATVRPAGADAAPARPGPARLPLALAASALVLWAYTLTVLTPRLVPLDRDHFFGELHMQAHDVRLAALLAVLAGLIAAIAGRGAVGVPAALGGVVLVTADVVIDRADLGGPAVFVATTGAGLAVLGTAVRIGARLDRVPPSPDAANRTRQAVAVLAAWCAPVIFVNATQLDDARLVPPGLLLGVGLSAAALLMLAGAAVRILVARWTPPLAALLALGALLAVAAWWIPGRPALAFVSILAPLTVMLTVAAGRWEEGRRWVWLPATLGALVIGLAAPCLQLMLALLVGSRLMRSAGYDNPPDGMLMVPGALLLGLALAALLVVVTHRRPATVDVRAPLSQPTA